MLTGEQTLNDLNRGVDVAKHRLDGLARELERCTSDRLNLQSRQLALYR